MNAPTAASGSSAPQADRAALNAALLVDEDALVAALIVAARFSREDRRRIAGIATRLVEYARVGRR